MKSLLTCLLFAGAAVASHAQGTVQYTLSFSSLGEAASSPATGTGSATYNPTAHTLFLSVTFTGLQGTTTAAHIHSPTAVAGTGTAGVATTTPSFAFFPLGVTSGSASTTLDLTLAGSYNSAYVTAHGGTTAQAETDLMASIAAGTAYWNIHTSFAGGGEIRSFFTPVPEPGTMALVGLGSLGLIGAVRRRS